MRKKLFRIVFVSLIVLVLLFLFLNKSRAEIYINFFDIGQGDSFLITIDKDFQILTDGGPSEDVLDYLSSSMPFYDKTIEIIILTHADADHLAGLVEVIQDYDVNQIYMPEWEHNTDLFKSWQQFIKEKNIKTDFITNNLDINILDTKIKFIHPSIATSENKDVNNQSVVFKFLYQDLVLLFPGDIELPAEERLVFEYKEKLKANLLKVPHHGSKTSSSIDFLKYVDPDIAVIQVGDDNKFNHPHGRVIDRYKRLDSKIFRTDTQESIELKLFENSIFYNHGQKSFWKWLIGENWEKVYTFG